MLGYAVIEVKVTLVLHVFNRISHVTAKMPPKALRDSKLKARARPNNWLEGTKMNKWSGYLSVGIVGVFFLSMWAGMLYLGPKYEKYAQEDYEKEDKEIQEKNERYIRLMTMRMSLEHARKDEIKKILEERAIRDGLRKDSTAPATE